VTHTAFCEDRDGERKRDAEEALRQHDFFLPSDFVTRCHQKRLLPCPRRTAWIPVMNRISCNRWRPRRTNRLLAARKRRVVILGRTPRCLSWSLAVDFSCEPSSRVIRGTSCDGQAPLGQLRSGSGPWKTQRSATDAPTLRLRIDHAPGLPISAQRWAAARIRPARTRRLF
jgi:hypothetical protein